jgi:hypothetical protein
MESVKSVKNKNFCHDCKKEIEIVNGEIKNGFLLGYETEQGRINVFKCKNCFEKDESLRNYQACEVYSRVVGYLRPVQQWNLGKQREFRERKEFKIKQRSKTSK